MSYTYPEAVTALESIANDFIKALRPHHHAYVRLNCDVDAKTASVHWDVYGIKVNMPVRPATSIMTQTEFEDWTAYLLHELGHPTHTDQAVWFDAVKSGHSRLLNALEDVRMEQALITSGIVPNARAVLSRLVSRKVVEARAKHWNPNARKEIGWTLCVLGRAANGYALDTTDLAWIRAQIKPGSTVGTVLAWALPELAVCTSTAACLKLTKRIANAIAVPQMEQKPGKSQGEGQQGQEGQEGQQSQQGQQGSEGTGEDDKRTSDAPTASETPAERDRSPAEGRTEVPSEGEAEGDNNAGTAGTGHGDGSTDDEVPVTSERDLAEHDLAPQGETLTGTTAAGAEKLIIDILRDKVIQSAPKTRNSAARTTVHGTRLRDAASKASRQRALLARALRANETDEREGGRKAGRLDRGALSRAMAGAPNVFAKREISEGYDTDVCVLLDASGSMQGMSMAAALEAGLIIAQAASSVGACCTVETFNSQGYFRAGALASRRAPNPADFGILQNAAGGGTPLSAHIARMAINQAKRAPHKRRVVFVVTDGCCDYGPATVKRMVAYLEQACGTVLAHVSIGTPLQGAFKAEVQVPHGAALAEIGLDHFVKVLQAL